MSYFRNSCSLLQLPISALSVAMTLATVALTASAQDMELADAKRSIIVAPRVSLDGKFTDNVDLSNLNKRSELISEISPGIRLTIDGARVKTYLDYALTQVFYTNNSAGSHSRNALTAFGSLEAVDNWAYIDFDGSISQQTVSAFGVQSLDNAVVNPNRTEVSSYRISPYLRGQMGDLAQYEARYSRSVTDSDSQVASGTTVTDSVIALSSGRSLRDLGWTADIGRQSVSYNQGRDTESDSINVGMFYNVSPQVRLSVKGGSESSNFTTLEKRSYNTNAVELNWFPSDLTSLSLTRSHRSYGDAYNLLVTHRSGRTVWKLVDAKDLSTATNLAGGGSIGSMYDLLFTQFASAEPDPIARATMVENYLQTNGISPTASATSGFLSSALSLQRRQELSFALLGVRDTITFIASRSETSRLDTLSASLDDLANFGNVRQQGFSVQLAHRLTPDYSLGVLLSQQQTTSASGTQDTRLRSLDVILSGKLGRRSTMSLGARHTVMDSDTTPYVESAVTGNLNVQF
jgi:uncharacterized protein (PEP-CTERM system associated)